MCIWSGNGKEVEGPIVAFKCLKKSGSGYYSPIQGTSWYNGECVSRYPVNEGGWKAGIFAFETKEGAAEYLPNSKIKRVRLTGKIVFHNDNVDDGVLHRPKTYDENRHNGFRAERAQILKWWQRA